jgi:hypothetical protein
MSQKPVHRGGLDLLRRQLLIARAGLREVALGGGDPLQEGQAEPAGQGRGDDAAAGAVGCRHGDQPHIGAGRGRAQASRTVISSLVTAAGTATGPAAGAAVPDGSTSAHTTADAAKMPAETQNATT